jgi:hypothetical protein
MSSPVSGGHFLLRHWHRRRHLPRVHRPTTKRPQLHKCASAACQHLASQRWQRNACLNLAVLFHLRRCKLCTRRSSLMKARDQHLQTRDKRRWAAS